MPTANLHLGIDHRAAISGDLNFETVMSILSKGLSYAETDANPVFDFKAVSSADSAAIALMLEWWRAATKHQKKIQFLNLPPSMTALIKVSDLEHVLIHEENSVK